MFYPHLSADLEWPAALIRFTFGGFIDGIWHKWVFVWTKEYYEEACLDGWMGLMDRFAAKPLQKPASVQRVQLLCGSEEIKDVFICTNWCCISLKANSMHLWLMFIISRGIDVYFKYTCVTGGAAMSSLISTLLTGVVTKAALSSRGITALLTAGVTASFIKEPAGGTKLGPATVYNIHIYSVTSCCTCMTSWQV